MKDTPSYLLLAVDLEMPLSLGTFFEDGIQHDSHITLLDSKKELDKDKLYEASRQLKFLEFLEAAQKNDPIPVNDLFDLDYFPSGYVVLRLKENSSLYRYLKMVHFSLYDQFQPITDFEDKFNAHITLAKSEMPKNVEGLEMVLKDSTVKFEDLLFSQETEKEGKFKVYDLTNHNSIDRYFRIQRLKNECNDL